MSKPPFKLFCLVSLPIVCVSVFSVFSALQGAKGITLFLVDTNTKGFSKGNKLKKLGMKAQDTCELFFEDCRVPASAVLGEVNKVRLCVYVFGCCFNDSLFNFISVICTLIAVIGTQSWLRISCLLLIDLPNHTFLTLFSPRVSST